MQLQKLYSNHSCVYLILANMKQSYLMAVVMIMMSMNSTGAQMPYPDDCVSCTDGKLL